MPTDEDDQDGHFFYNHPERGGLLRRLGARSLCYCHLGNCQLGTQRMMGVRGKAVSRQAHPARVYVPLPKGNRKKVELPLGLSRRVHLRRVLFCLLLFGFVPKIALFGDASSSAFHSHWLTQLMVGCTRFLM